MKKLIRGMFNTLFVLAGLFGATQAGAAEPATPGAQAPSAALFAQLLAEGKSPLQALSDVLVEYGDDPAQVRAVVAAAVDAVAQAAAGAGTPTQAMIDQASDTVAGLALGQVSGPAREAVFQGVLLAGADPTRVATLAATAAGQPPGAAPGAPLGNPPVAGGGAGSGGGVSPSS